MKTTESEVAGRERRQRGSISAAEIVTGALQLAAENGMEALSMPRLARSLGIGVTSIYWYFENKDALIEAMTEEAARRLRAQMAGPAGTSWQDHAFATFSRLFSIMQEDDLLCDLLFMRGNRLSESALHYLWPQLEEGLRRMVEAGFTHEEGLRHHNMLSLHMLGASILSRQMRQAGTSARDPRPVLDNFPNIARAAGDIRGVTEESYRTQLHALIEGIAARQTLALRK